MTNLIVSCIYLVMKVALFMTVCGNNRLKKLAECHKDVCQYEGLLCGACHNRTRFYGREKIFASGSSNAKPEDGIRCSRRHSVGKNLQKEYDSASFAERLPKSKL